MFGRKTIFILVMIGSVNGYCPCFAQGQRETIEALKHYDDYKGILLDSAEIEGFNKKRELSTSWFQGCGEEGKPRTVKGFIQEFEAQDSPVVARLKFGQFMDADTAKDALARHAENVATIFQMKPWANLHLKHSPDEILFSDSGGSCGILFLIDRVCILVSCRKGNAMARQQSAVLFVDAVMSRLLALQDVAETTVVAGEIVNTNSLLAVEKTNSIPLVTASDAPVSDADSSTERLKFPWWLLFCIGGLIALGWRITQNKKC
jgi:hypothetical protein